MAAERRSLFPIYCALALLTGAVIFEGALIGWLYSRVEVLESQVRERNTLLVQPSPDTVTEEEPTSSAEVVPRQGTPVHITQTLSLVRSLVVSYIDRGTRVFLATVTKHTSQFYIDS